MSHLSSYECVDCTQPGFMISFTLSQTGSQLHVHCATLSNDGPILQYNFLIVRLNCVAPKWSNSHSRVHHLVFTLGQMVCHVKSYYYGLAGYLCIKELNTHAVLKRLKLGS